MHWHKFEMKFILQSPINILHLENISRNHHLARIPPDVARYEDEDNETATLSTSVIKIQFNNSSMYHVHTTARIFPHFINKIDGKVCRCATQIQVDTHLIGELSRESAFAKCRMKIVN